MRWSEGPIYMVEYYVVHWTAVEILWSPGTFLFFVERCCWNQSEWDVQRKIPNQEVVFAKLRFFHNQVSVDSPRRLVFARSDILFTVLLNFLLVDPYYKKAFSVGCVIIRITTVSADSSTPHPVLCLFQELRGIFWSISSRTRNLSTEVTSEMLPLQPGHLSRPLSLLASGGSMLQSSVLALKSSSIVLECRRWCSSEHQFCVETLASFHSSFT